MIIAELYVVLIENMVFYLISNRLVLSTAMFWECMYTSDIWIHLLNQSTNFRFIFWPGQLQSICMNPSQSFVLSVWGSIIIWLVSCNCFYKIFPSFSVNLSGACSSWPILYSAFLPRAIPLTNDSGNGQWPPDIYLLLRKCNLYHNYGTVKEGYFCNWLSNSYDINILLANFSMSGFLS